MRQFLLAIVFVLNYLLSGGCNVHIGPASPPPPPDHFLVTFQNNSSTVQDVTVKVWYSATSPVQIEQQNVGPNELAVFHFGTERAYLIEIDAGWGAENWNFPGAGSGGVCPYWAWNVEFPTAFAYGGQLAQGGH